jgi:hypothetical protein
MAAPTLPSPLRVVSLGLEVFATANATAPARLVDGEPWLIDCRPAADALGRPPRVVLHAGPPLDRTSAGAVRAPLAWFVQALDALAGS